MSIFIETRHYYAAHILVFLAQQNKKPVKTQRFARDTGASLVHCNLIIRKIIAKGAIESYRGPAGGYVLVHPLDAIPLSHVLSSVALIEDTATGAYGEGVTRFDDNLSHYLSQFSMQDLLAEG